VTDDAIKQQRTNGAVIIAFAADSNDLAAGERSARGGYGGPITAVRAEVGEMLVLVTLDAF
jgi:hypothetical protein